MSKNIPSSRETKMEPLLSFPYNAFLMLRAEYVQILQDDLQAKLLRIIEAHIETQRLVLYREAMNKSESNQPIDIPKDIYVPISYKLFMNDLFGLVTSENTIKKNLNVLIAYKIIFRKEPPKKKYAPPEYSINTNALQILLDALKNPGYQTLIPSILDTLKDSYPQTLIPSWYQELIPSILKSSSEEKSRVSRVDTTIRLEEDYSSKNESDPSSIPSSTRSSSSSEKRETPHHIANADTGNGESMTIREPSPPSPLSAEEQRIQGYWCELGFVERPAAREHWRTLSKHIKSLEDMQSLFDYTRNAVRDKKDKRVYPGNLVDHVDGWKQSKAPPPEKPKQSKSHDIGAEMRRMKEQYTKAGK